MMTTRRNPNPNHRRSCSRQEPRIGESAALPAADRHGLIPASLMSQITRSRKHRAARRSDRPAILDAPGGPARNLRARPLGEEHGKATRQQATGYNGAGGLGLSCWMALPQMKAYAQQGHRRPWTTAPLIGHMIAQEETPA